MNETMDIEKLVKGKTKSLKVKVEFRNSNWNSLHSYMVGERLYVEISLERETSNEILSKYGFLKPVTCYATPNKESFGPRYYILENGCVRDETFRYEIRKTHSWQSAAYERQAYFSFESFSFKERSGKLYLHCSARFCINQTSGNKFDFNGCENMCEENKETTAMTTTTRRAIMTTTSVNSVLSRMKRAAINLGIYSEEKKFIERSTEKVVHLDEE
uniref:uncharacterized protein LOC120342818 n=1 Tax=Styela clava TaxID=7725 RepID=UPI00193AC2D0|nr:uncharacterized protein LOC120342818 [Styela clava]